MIKNKYDSTFSHPQLPILQSWSGNALSNVFALAHAACPFNTPSTFNCFLTHTVTTPSATFLINSYHRHVFVCLPFALTTFSLSDNIHVIIQNNPTTRLPVGHVPNISIGSAVEIIAQISLVLPKSYFWQCSPCLTYAEYGLLYLSCLRPALLHVLPDQPLLRRFAHYPFADVWPIDPEGMFDITVRVPSELLEQFAQKLFELADQVPALADMTFFCNIDLTLTNGHNVRDVNARTASVLEAFKGINCDAMDSKEWQLIATLDITAFHQALFWSRAKHEALVSFFTR